MITNTGKGIIAKYLVGQAPAYASYIAVGCGAKPLPSDADLTLVDYSTKKTLDFEMFRVPITSRGYVNEDGVSKIVLTAELPTEERYEITEVGVYSAGSNPVAGAYDSKNIYSFNDAENWEYHSQSAAEAIPTIYVPLDVDGETGVIAGEYKLNPATKQYDSTVATKTATPVFNTNADNKIFVTGFNNERLNRHERCRFLNNIIMIQGDNATLNIDGSGKMVPAEGSNHIHLTGTSIDFSKNSPKDELKLAFSVINKSVSDTSSPDNVKILVEFSSSDLYDDGQWARLEVDIDNTSFVAGEADIEQDFSTNRYVIITKQLQELVKSSGFSWGSVGIAKIYVSITKNGQVSEDYYIGLDGLRLENKSVENPLYGLTGYSVIKNTGSLPIVKIANTTNYLEFRFGMDVQ
jgi:hypothetical protein